jgi:hypothetical protein
MSKADSDASETMTRVPIFIDPATEEALEELLGYGDSKSAYIRRALRAQLAEDCDTYDE